MFGFLDISDHFQPIDLEKLSKVKFNVIMKPIHDFIVCTPHSYHYHDYHISISGHLPKKTDNCSKFTRNQGQN